MERARTIAAVVPPGRGGGLGEPAADRVRADDQKGRRQRRREERPVFLFLLLLLQRQKHFLPAGLEHPREPEDVVRVPVREPDGAQGGRERERPAAASSFVVPFVVAAASSSSLALPSARPPPPLPAGLGERARGALSGVKQDPRRCCCRCCCCCCCCC